MHIGRQIIQQLVLRFGEADVERWTVEMKADEFSDLQRHKDRRRAHDVSMVIMRGSELAVIRKHGYPADGYRIPSGGIHPEEGFLDGTAREAWEETGLRVSVEDYLLRVHVAFTHGEQTVPWITHVMIARPDTTLIAPQDTAEIESACWMEWDELLSRANPALEGSGQGGLAYRARLHEKVHQLVSRRAEMLGPRATYDEAPVGGSRGR